MISLHKIPITARPLRFLADAMREVNNADTLVIVPTQRNRRSLAAIGEWNTDIQTVAEFNSRAMLHRSVLLPTELRSYYLYKAATALSEAEQTSLMNRNASNFLKNYISFVRRSAALLPFFRELCAEQVDVSQLMKAGLYQDYEEQLTVLLRLWELYLTAIHSMGYVDEWESFLTPTIDTSYVQRYKRYIFLVGGYLNNFELAQLEQLSAICDVSIFFNYIGDSQPASLSAHPQQEKFAERFGITEIETFDGDKALAWASVQSSIAEHTDEALVIRLDYTSRPLHTSDISANQPPQLQIVPCESAMAQYDMITRQICCAHWLEDIDFADMAVVLPAERMASWFLYSDPAQLYRVSAGREIASFPFFELFQNVIALLRGFRSNLIKLGDIERIFAHPLFKELDNIDIHMAVEELRALTKSGRLLYTLEDLRYSDIKGMQSLYKLIAP
ncbi:MAG: hypothetical protein LBV04_03315, partial [Deferribacteraceae bacterium]|nr:hypothetical protein [Deferribacteraceae bacterium]